MSSRRDFLGTSVAAAFTTATSLAQTPDNTRQAEQNHSASNPGQSNEPLRRIHPSSDAPPPTDHGIPGPFWHSFDLTHRRIQGGGWTHQVTERELPLSKEIAGVNMRLTRGAFRELHWHLADEWALMLTGHARITLFSPDGTTFIDDVQAGDLWLFPAGSPHSIQGTGDDGCEFLLVFNQGSFSEESTFLLSDWLMHTPPDVLVKNFGLTPEAIAKLPKGDPLYIFPSDPPAQSLAADRAEAAHNAGKPTRSYTFRTGPMPPTKSNPHGTVKVIDSHNFPASANIAATIVTLKPGGLRELHWHPNASEWQFWIQGQGRMTVFNAKQDARTTDFRANDVGYVPKMAGHYIENTGTEDLIFLEMFAASEFQEVSLNNWLRSIPTQVVQAHTNLSAEDIAKIPARANDLLG